MTIDLDALERMARDAIFNDDPEDWPLEGAVGWDRPEDNKFVAALTPGTVLALIARVRELEAIVNDGGNQAAKYWTRLTEAEARAQKANLQILDEVQAKNEALDERDRYRAVLDRVSEAARFGSGMDVNPTRMAGPNVEDSERWWQSWHHRADAAWRRNITDALDDKEAEK